MRKIFLTSLFVIGFSLFIPLFNKVNAASLKFDKTTESISVGSTFNAAVVVDAGTDNIAGVDAYVLYDATTLEALTVTAGTYFTTVTKNIESGKVWIGGYLLPSEIRNPKTGTGTLGTITFKGLKNKTIDVTYDCNTSSSTTSKIVKADINASNIIVCSQNGKLTATVGSGGSSAQDTPTPQPTSSGGGSEDSGSNETPAQLPQSGIFDNIIKYAVPGAILIIIGGVLRLVL